MSEFSAQNKIETVVLNWGENQKKNEHDQEFFIPYIIGQEYNINKPNFSQSFKIGQGIEYDLEVISKDLELASSNDVSFLNYQKIDIPNELILSYKTSKARSKNNFTLSFFPFIKENDKVYRIKSLNIKFLPKQISSTFKKDFVNQSILSDESSTFYKISVKSDGIYKLDKSWFESNNIDVSSINPNFINIYGNGAGKLSELNSVSKIDDLAKNAILFIGDGDDIFESNEYFLFYAWGPNKWLNTNGIFRRDLNIYSDNSYYFIRKSSTEPALRITDVASTNQTETVNVTDFNHYDIYEQESHSLVGGGQRWYGDLFDTELSKNFNFSVPNIVTTDPITFNSSLASNANSGSNTFSYIINGTTAYSSSLGTTSGDYRRLEYTFNYLSNNENIPLTINVNRSSPSVMTYLDKIELNCRRKLIFSGSQMRFRDTKSIGSGNIGKFTLSNVQASYFVWDLSNKQIPKLIQGQQNGTNFEFNVTTDSLREFVCSNGINFSSPTYIGVISNQNLHALDPAKLLLVTHPNFLSEANRLAQIHENDGMSTHVVTTEQIYNEFSSGMVDPTAIKWFAKMFYDRANGDVSKMPENLLLFGDGTYDPKNRVSGNNYFVPTYQVLNSEDHIGALVTDDYFGMLDDNEAISDLDMMDIGVGRMIVSTNEQAKEQVDKVEQYLKRGINTNSASNCATDNISCSSFGDWRLKYIQIADDEAYFINEDTEPQYDSVTKNHPEMNADKIYLDAYPRVATAGGIRFPDVNDAITDRVQNGSLIINYVGHGGEVGAAVERVITIPMIQSWSNKCNLNLFVSATCEFTKYDDPARVSAGEWV
ncbi:MAG: type IX secretion system sortase PorU, partial [Bacteroidota bacterium]